MAVAWPTTDPSGQVAGSCVELRFGARFLERRQARGQDRRQLQFGLVDVRFARFGVTFTTRLAPSGFARLGLGGGREGGVEGEVLAACRVVGGGDLGALVLG